MTLACEDAYSKLVEVVTVADVSDEDRVGNSLFAFSLLFGFMTSAGIGYNVMICLLKLKS